MLWNLLSILYFVENFLNFFDNACTKTQNMALKTSKMEKICLSVYLYWYNSFLGRLRVDERGFFHQKPILKKGSPDQRSRCPTCAEACQSPFKYDYTPKDQPHQILRHLKHILKFFFFESRCMSRNALWWDSCNLRWLCTVWD